jgi:hypothetical protein
MKYACGFAGACTGCQRAGRTSAAEGDGLVTSLAAGVLVACRRLCWGPLKVTWQLWCGGLAI